MCQNCNDLNIYVSSQDPNEVKLLVELIQQKQLDSKVSVLKTNSNAENTVSSIEQSFETEDAKLTINCTNCQNTFNTYLSSDKTTSCYFRPNPDNHFDCANTVKQGMSKLAYFTRSLFSN